MDPEPSSSSIAQATRAADQLYRRLADMLEQGRLAEHGRLPPEGELAEEFGVSRYVIREALTRLRLAGVIVSRKGSGSFLRKRKSEDVDAPDTSSAYIDSIAQVRRCFEFRIGVEGETAYFAAQNRNAEALREMRAALDRLEEAVASGNVGMDADYEFHLAVARATGNSFFATVIESMRVPIEFGINLGRSLSLRRPKRHLMRIQAEHVGIFASIEAGDKDDARRAMRNHLTDACNRMFNGPDAGDLHVPSSIVQGMEDVKMTFEGPDD
jgi:GntR family transcriptional regulator, transcriptional repressor for pyruvate dehydrogenase complex